MDRRQQKTRKAIFNAFTSLLSEKKYNHITVQDIIDAADVGRTTFYAHFETKDDLLRSLCEELFGHIISNAVVSANTHRPCSDSDAPHSVFCHLLQHLQENSSNILGLLSCESNEIFLGYFRESLAELVRQLPEVQERSRTSEIPQAFLINHITGSYVEMVHWWIKGHMVQSPEELDRYFCAVIKPVLG